MLIEKILLGITLSAPIGPVSLEMIKRGLNSGFWSAFIIRLGAAMGNMLCLISAYFGLGLFVGAHSAMAVCTLMGALVLIYMGTKSVIVKKQHQLVADQSVSGYKVANGLATGFILSVANPIAVVFWLSIFAGSLDTTQNTQTWFGLVQNFSIIAGVLIWGIFLSGLLAIGQRFINQKFINMITVGAGIILIAFGLKFGYKAILLLV